MTMALVLNWLYLACWFCMICRFARVYNHHYGYRGSIE